MTLTSVCLTLRPWFCEQRSKGRNQTGLSEEELEDPSNMHPFAAHHPPAHFTWSVFYQAAQSCASLRVMGLGVGEATRNWELLRVALLMNMKTQSWRLFPILSKYLCFWRTWELCCHLNIVKPRLLPILCLACTEEGLFWKDIWWRNWETRL